jgi:hypothetical protein
VMGKDGKGPDGGVFIVDKLQALRLSDSFHTVDSPIMGPLEDSRNQSSRLINSQSVQLNHSHPSGPFTPQCRGLFTPHCITVSALRRQPCKDLSCPSLERLDSSGLRG